MEQGLHGSGRKSPGRVQKSCFGHAGHLVMAAGACDCDLASDFFLFISEHCVCLL